MDGHPIERFDPLLRNLLAWCLVDQDDDGRWSLRPEVGQRLTQLTELTRHDAPSEVVYFGHACATCRANGLTRLRDGRYLCDGCRRAADLAAVATPLPKPRDQKSRRSVLHRDGGLAS